MILYFVDGTPLGSCLLLAATRSAYTASAYLVPQLEVTSGKSSVINKISKFDEFKNDGGLLDLGAIELPSSSL